MPSPTSSMLADVEPASKTFKPEICVAKPSRASSLLMRHVASAAPTSSAEATAHALVYAVPSGKQSPSWSGFVLPSVLMHDLEKQ